MDNPFLRRAFVGFLLARGIYRVLNGGKAPPEGDTAAGNLPSPPVHGVAPDAPGITAAAVAPPRPAPVKPAEPLVDDLPPIPTQRLFGISVSELDMAQTVARIIHWSGRRPARNVVTTNLDHVMKLRTDPLFQRVYEEADIVTADGMPFVWLSKHEKTPLKGRVTGSDMIRPVMRAAAEAGRSVFLFGSTMERLHTAAKILKAENPRLEFAGAYAPPFGFERDPKIQAELTRIIRTVRPDIIMVALGAPKQEVWSAGMADCVRHGVFLNIGGGLDFLSGEIRRAPKWMQSAGLEWLWRASTEPFRLGRRYFGILVQVPKLYRMHKRDRAQFMARERRQIMALESERHYREARAATREAERERALRARAGRDE